MNEFDDKNEEYLTDAKHCYDHLSNDIKTPQTQELATKIHDAICTGEYSNGTILAALTAVQGFVLSEAKDRIFAYAMTAAIATAVRQIFDNVKAVQEAAKPKPDTNPNMIFLNRRGTN